VTADAIVTPPHRSAPAPTSTRTEVVAGLTTFLATAYIVVVNPAILSDGTGMPFDGVLAATVLLAASMTILMGVYARLPFAVAPGMGLNAFFAYTLVVGQKVPWPTALGMVFWAGVLFLAISATPLRERVATAIPPSLRTAMAGGIGLLLTVIGLKGAGIIVADPVTMVKAGALTPQVLLAALGLVIAVALMVRGQAIAFLTSITSITVLAWALGLVSLPPSWVSRPDFTAVTLRLDVWGALAPALWPSIVAVLFTDLFDSLSTLIGVAEATGYTDEQGRPIRLRQGLIVDAWATLGAGLLGSSSGTAYVESAAGINAGGRTGLTAVVAGLCFLPCLFLAPLAAAVPAFATAPVLIVVGVLMFRTCRTLPFERLEEIVPAFLTLVLIPLTLSITQGLLWGLVAYVVAFAIAGRVRDLTPWNWGLGLLASGLLYLHG
jgi:AGZA family xanthine/uracil permease-like MFS transporter